jgi:POT family proton-dependent oligopeptide transporter
MTVTAQRDRTLAGCYGEDREVPYFGLIGAAAIVVGLVMLALTPMLRRLMGDVR